MRANNYTLGFAFSQDGKRVVLIRKAHPAWQAGKLNGVGGRLKLDQLGYATEGFLGCMVREFQEETGVLTSGWLHLGYMQGPDWQCNLYYLRSDYVLDHVSTQTDEEISIHEVAGLTPDNTVGNTVWLIHAALEHFKNPNFTITAEY